IDSVDVTSRLVAAGTVYDISFGGTLAHTNVTQLIPHGGSLTARNEVQQVDVEGAASGTYNLKFTFDANGNGTLDAGEESASTPFTVGWTDAQVQAALEGMSSIGAGNVAVAVSGGKYTIGFIGALAAKNLPSLQLTSTTLTAQDEQQKVQVVNATGGTFTLTIAYNDGVTRRTGKTNPISYGASATDVRSALGGITVNGSMLGVASFSVARVGDTYTVTFTGGTLGGKNIEPLTGDAGRLVNQNPLGSFSVSLASNSGNTSVDPLLDQLQSAIDAAVMTAGLTPGFLVSGLISSGTTFTASMVTGGTVPFGAVYFTPQGDHIHNGQTAGLPDNPVAGAVSAIVPHPTLANIIWVGTVNGGIWRSTDASIPPTPLGQVQWTPLLDLGPAMSIVALERDPTVVPTAIDGSDAVLLAGIGARSNYGEPPNFPSFGSQLTGIIRSTNGGNSWQQLGTRELSGLTITGLVARGNIIAVAAEDPTGGAAGGVFVSTDGGQTFPRLSGNAAIYGLPAGDAFDLQGDPGDLGRFYVALSGGGVYFTTNFGAHWDPTGGSAVNAQQFNT